MDKTLLIVDRDGTLVKDKDFLGKSENWRDEVIPIKPVIEFLKFIQNSSDCKTFVVSNQAGVARGYFDCSVVEQVNSYINDRVLALGVKIDGWRYCPDVDESYASSHRKIVFDSNFVKVQTKRKPSTDLINEVLRDKDLRLSDFDHIFVLGDRVEDEMLAQRLDANYINVINKNYKRLQEEYLAKV